MVSPMTSSRGKHGFPRALIGVPRFELGTSPTRTERATRLRHTPRRQTEYRLGPRDGARHSLVTAPVQTRATFTATLAASTTRRASEHRGADGQSLHGRRPEG